MSERILVTGGAGFIGSHLVERLEANRVDVIDDLSRGSRAWLPREAVLHTIDIRDADAVQRVVRATRPNVVIHLAALHFIPEVEGAPELAWEINATGTRILLEALHAQLPEVLLFASSAAVYPDRAGPIPESCPVGPIDVYGRTKVEGERLVTRFAADTGTRCVIARIFNVIGRRETNRHVVPELVDQLRAGRSVVRLGNLSSRRDYTDVADAAAALRELISPMDATETTFNVGSGTSVSVAELVATCEQILERRIRVEIEPSRRRAHDRSELVADVGRLMTTTGWSPRRSVRETMADLLALG